MVDVFNPNEHVIQLKSRDGSKDYLPIQWRLVWFREKYPQGTIETEMLHLDLDRETFEETTVWNNEKRRSEKVMKQAKGFVLFKATVKDGKGGVATGTKSEKAASFPDYIEKAETGAIGRALAALGYGTQFAPELSEEHRLVDSPVDRQAASNGSNGGNGNHQAAATPSPTDQAAAPVQESLVDQAPITEQQIDSIRKLCGYMSKTEPDGLTALSYGYAKKLIPQLTAEYRAFKQTQREAEKSATTASAAQEVDTQRLNELYLAAKAAGYCANPTGFRLYCKQLLRLKKLDAVKDLTPEQVNAVQQAIESDAA